MLASITWPQTLREIIESKNPSIINDLNKKRITGNTGASYWVLIVYSTGTVFVESIVGDVLDVVSEWIPIHTVKTLSIDIRNLDRLYFNWNWQFYLMLV